MVSGYLHPRNGMEVRVWREGIAAGGLLLLDVRLPGWNQTRLKIFHKCMESRRIMRAKEEIVRLQGIHFFQEAL